MTNINTTMNAREWLMLITLSVLWGGSFFFVAIALEDIPAFSIVTLRVGLAAIVLWMVVLLMKLDIPRNPKTWFSLLVMGVLNNAIPFTLITWGQTQVESSVASIFNAAMPLFTVIIASIFLPDEKVTTPKALGVILGFFGVFVMVGFPDAASSGYTLAQLAILSAGISYALASTYGRRFRDMGIHPIVLTAAQVTVASIVMLPIALNVDGVTNIMNAGFSSILSVFLLAVLSTAVAYILYFRILASAGAVNVSLVTLLVPISAILLGITILGENLELIHVIGMSLIATGLLIIDGRLWAGLKKLTTM